jgi:carbamoyl-phosphate synthase large subunit
MKKMKLLITSVGSLVSQNILDCLEQKRDVIDVIGLNADAANPRNFRCDRSYLVPPLDHALPFKTAFLDIVAKENPDMILPGRDHDVVFLAEIKDTLPQLKRIIPFGHARLAALMQDKWSSYRYAAENDLPFADSYSYRGPGDLGGLNDFLCVHPFPLLVKPRLGYGSLGVRYVWTGEQIDGLVADASGHEILFQEYLGPLQDFDEYRRQLKYGLPLFFQIPETSQYAAQTILSADGQIAEVFSSVNSMVSGRAEYSRRIDIPELDTVVRKYASVLSRDGWYGPLNLQLKPDRQGTWKVFELNPRMTGTTSARYKLGYDEIGLMTDFFLPEKNLPNHTKAIKPPGAVFKYLTDYYLADPHAEALKVSNVWQKS